MQRPFKLTARFARWKATQESEHNYGWRISEEYQHADESEYWGSENAGPDWETPHFSPPFCFTASVSVLEITGSRANLPVREEASKRGIAGVAAMAAILRPSETYRDGIDLMDQISIMMSPIVSGVRRNCTIKSRAPVPPTDGRQCLRHS